MSSANKDFIFNNFQVPRILNKCKLFHFKDLKCGSAYISLLTASTRRYASDHETKALAPASVLDRNHTFSRNLNAVFSNFFPTVYAAETDIDDLGVREWRRQQMKEFLSQETKEERIRRMFTLDDYGIISPELKYILYCGIGAIMVGGVYGVCSGSSMARDNFKRRHAATPFESEYIARRQMADTMTLNGLKNGFGNGMKLAFCSTVYMFVTITAATYNNKITIYEHVAAGATMGVLWRLNYGVKGAVVAGALGAVLGLFGGGATLLYLKLTGTTFEEMRYLYHELYAPDKQAISRAKARDKKKD